MATNSGVLKDFVNELNSLGIEIEARRRFCEDVVAYIRDRGLVDDFNRYRAELHKPVEASLEMSRPEDDGEG